MQSGTPSSARRKSSWAGGFRFGHSWRARKERLGGSGGSTRLKRVGKRKKKLCEDSILRSQREVEKGESIRN